MPKPTMLEADEKLERDIIETMLAGLKQWRPDLQYPESYSDTQGCVRALLMMFSIERRALVKPLRLKCPDCEGLGHLVTRLDPDTEN